MPLLRPRPPQFSGDAVRIAAAFAVVVVSLASRALVDRLLAQAGGGERVAAWAQLQSAAELVTGVCAAGVGAGLTVLVAATPARTAQLLRAALALGLGVAALALLGFTLAVLALGAPPRGAPLEPRLMLLAAGAGWLAVVASLTTSLWAGQQRQGRVLLLACASGALAVGAAGLGGGDLVLLIVAQALPGAALALGLLIGRNAIGGGTQPERLSSWRALRRYLPVGVAIGLASPAAALASRGILANALSWHEAGLVQALWRSSDWITSLAAGALALYFLPRFALAADRDALRAALVQAARVLLPASALALALLYWQQHRVLGLLYDHAFDVPDRVAALFYAGDLLRIVAWLPLFALYALGRTRVLIAGEFLSLPLFALALSALGERLTLATAGAAWLVVYGIYAAFNALALRYPCAATKRGRAA